MSASNGQAPRKRSLFALLTELPNLFGHLIRAEVELLRREVLHRLKGTGIGLGLMVVAISLASVFLTLLSVAGVLLLALVMPAWQAVLMCAGVVLVLAVIAFAIGSRLLSGTTAPIPQRTLDNVRSDIATIRGDLRESDVGDDRGA